MNIRRLVKKLIPSNLFPAIEPYGHLAEAVLFNLKSGFPARGLKVIGVTGTNGKTTTAFMIHRMLSEAGHKTGLMTTVAYGVNDDIRPQVHHMTNVPMPELMRRLKWMRDQGVEWLVLETTSQALAQNRVWGVPYSVAVLTNVTHEHLDYHKTFERYRDAKRKLFKLTDNNHSGLRAGVINAEDPSAALFAADILHPVTYGIAEGGIRALNIKQTAEGSTFTVQLPDESYQITCHLPGTFNVYNALATACVGRVVGLSQDQIERGIAALQSVEGRMTSIDEGQKPKVIVDFAHTPDAFEKLFKDLRPVVKGKLVVMFGSAGRRDETKRAEQGELAGRYADEVIITEEDDRDADGQAIMEEIANGAVKAGKQLDNNLFLVHDRAKAIAYAIGRGRTAQDTVLLLGKGHEKTIERADGEHKWDEIGSAKKAARKLAAR